jgi:integrase
MRGSIVKRGKKSWRIKFDLYRDTETGRRETRYITVRGTKADAQKELTRQLSKIDRGDFVEPSKTTLAEYLRSWLNDYAAHALSGKTFERYQEICEKHLIPALGKTPIARLQPAQIQRCWSDALSSGRRDGKGGLSRLTVQHHHRVLRLALNHAVRLQLLVQNPAQNAAPPRAQKKQIEVLDEEQIRTLLVGLEGTDLYPVVLVAATTGMRRGELLALRWQDIDLEEGVIAVNRAVEQISTGIAFKVPKTRSSRRNIPIPRVTIEELRRHRAEKASSLLALGIPLRRDTLVFCNDLGDVLSPRAVSKAFTTAAARLELPRITFHGMRHSHLTHLLKMGVNVKVVSERAGHTSVATTLDLYGHVMPTMQEAAVRLLDESLARA